MEGVEKLYFIGVTTGQSSIMSVFPQWATLLGLKAVVVGRDLPLRAEPELYRQVIRSVEEDGLARGALVTSHKVAVYRHAADFFAELDEWARLCGEVSCISKADSGLRGRAIDPISSRNALLEFLSPTYWRDHPAAEVLCLGAGGSGTAITCRLLLEEPPPRRILVTNRGPQRLEDLRKAHQQLGLRTVVEYRAVSGPEDSDSLLQALPPGSLVINATGMGKDIPGSPLSDRALFPEGAYVWDFNYRCDLRFLHQAWAQAAERGLQVHDGWAYFLYGWAEVIGEVFGIELSPDRFRELAAAAEPLRPLNPGQPTRPGGVLGS